MDVATNGKVALYVFLDIFDQRVDPSDPFNFFYLLCGSASIKFDTQENEFNFLVENSFVVPQNMNFHIQNPSKDLEILQVSLKKDFFQS